MPSAVAETRADSPRSLAVLLLSRLVLNLQFRVVYPFLPAIARGLGVPLETASLLIAVRSLTSVAAPLYGLAGDRFGRRVMMLAGLAALVCGALAVAVAPAFGVAAVAFALLGFAKASFDPAAQAHLGDNVPYERRGRVLGILELAWGLSWLVGVPLSGFAIAGWGWQAPFWAIALLGLAALATLVFGCRSCGAGRAVRVVGGRIPWRTVAPAMAVNGILIAANENVFVVYGAWLESRFGLAVTAIGLVSVIIFAAELTAELASAGLVDRLGKRRSVLAGFALNGLAYLLLPRLAGGLGTGLLGVALVFLTFEFSIVSLIPLVSELSTFARATVLALSASSAAIARMVASLTGPRLWSAGGITANALASAAAMAVAVALLYLAVHEARVTGPESSDTR